MSNFNHSYENLAVTSSKCRIPSSVTCPWGNIDFNISAQSGETQVQLKNALVVGKVITYGIHGRGRKTEKLKN
jgi:hypothetical protein